MKTAAVILAGGASRRMGFPKALLRYEGRTFLDGLLETFGGCDTVVVVLGHETERIRTGISSDANFVTNPHPENGQLSSLQTGLRVLESYHAIFFTPVDYPAIRQSTVRALLPFAGEFAMPRYQGRRGHPVLINRDLADQLLSCGTSARDVIRAHEPVYVDVDDPGILEDIDDPVAYARLQETSLLSDYRKISLLSDFRKMVR